MKYTVKPHITKYVIRCLVKWELSGENDSRHIEIWGGYDY